MKKLRIFIIFMLVFCISSWPVYAANNGNIQISISDQLVYFDSEVGRPFIDSNSRTQVPFRVALESFGAQVLWDSENRTAVAIKGDTIVKIPIGKSYIIKNDVFIITDTNSIIKDGKTYLPIRPVFEALGAEVNWDCKTSTVKVKRNEIESIAVNYSYGVKSTDKYQYTGYLNNDIPDIKGTFAYRNGDVYEGGISAGLYSGYGKLEFWDGSSYFGNFTDGLKDGSGLYYSDEALIVGEWEKGTLRGKASISYFNGSRYEGNVENGLRSGQGILTFFNRDSYNGNWRNDKYHGQGTYFFNDGSYYSGSWKNGYLHGNVLYQTSSYKRYQCEFDQGEAISVKEIY